MCAMHLSSFYIKMKNLITKCTLCRHKCVIKPGCTGKCGVRQNVQGELFSYNYGQIIAANIDPVEKKPIYHFYPGHKTFSIAAPGCNFICSFCQNWQISQIKLKDNLPSQPETAPQTIINSALKSNCLSVSYTYTEPGIFWEYALDCMTLAHAANLKNLVVSNGYGSQEAWEAARGLVDAANIDLKAMDENFYQKICGGSLAEILETLTLIQQMGIWLEITTLLIPGENDDFKQMEKLTSFIAGLSPDIPWHISAYFPAYKYNVPRTEVSSLLRARDICLQAGLKYIYLGNVGLMGAGNTLCPNCGQIFVERSGYKIKKNSVKNNLCAKCGYGLAGKWL